MVSIKESYQKGVALCTFAREKRLRNQMLLELLGPEKSAQRSPTLLLHSTELARNYRVALSLLWVPEAKSN